MPSESETLLRYVAATCGLGVGVSLITIAGYVDPSTIAPKPWVPDVMYGALMGGIAVGSLAVLIAIAHYIEVEG